MCQFRELLGARQSRAPSEAQLQRARPGGRNHKARGCLEVSSRNKGHLLLNVGQSSRSWEKFREPASHWPGHHEVTLWHWPQKRVGCAKELLSTHTRAGLALVGVMKPPAMLRDTAQAPADRDARQGWAGAELALVGGSRADSAVPQPPASREHKTLCGDLATQQHPLKASQGEKAKPVHLLLFWGALPDMGCRSCSCHVPPSFGHTYSGPCHQAPQ